MSENLSILIKICLVLGVEFDENKFNNIKDECEKIRYLLISIYYFLGGE